MSPDALKKKIYALIELLEQRQVINKAFSCRIATYVTDAKVSNEIFVTGTLHGEFYFTHFLFMDSCFGMVDFHQISKGPIFVDLATFM
jgi:hypothetical protein